MRLRGAFAAVSILVLALVLAHPSSVVGTPPAGPVTIVTAIDFSVRPFSGTFEVTEGSDILGCSDGRFVDFPTGIAIRKVFTCETGQPGTFTVLFQPIFLKPGPGDSNGHWNVLEGTGPYATLRGEGDFSVVFDFPTLTGVETLTGDIHFDP